MCLGRLQAEQPHLAKVAQNFLGDGGGLGDAGLERDELLAGIAPDGIDKLVERYWIDCHDQAPSRPTIAIAATFWFGMPPRFCEQPKVGVPATWRSPARPRSCRSFSYLLRMPDAPLGWPQHLRPTSIWHGYFPSAST